MQKLFGTWRGVSSTIPDYPAKDDILCFNVDGTIDYEFAAPGGRKSSIHYTVLQDGPDLIIYPEKGTYLVKRNGYRIRISHLDDTRISLRLDHRETIYEKEKMA